jgi:hypothetical protein
MNDTQTHHSRCTSDRRRDPGCLAHAATNCAKQRPKPNSYPAASQRHHPAQLTPLAIQSGALPTLTNSPLYPTPTPASAQAVIALASPLPTPSSTPTPTPTPSDPDAWWSWPCNTPPRAFPDGCETAGEADVAPPESPLTPPCIRTAYTAPCPTTITPRCWTSS